MRIRSRLLLLVSAVLVPALLVSVIGAAYIYSEEQKFNRATAIETARALARAVERDLARRESILRTLAAAPTLHDGDLQRFYDFALAVANENGAAIILSDLEGRQLLNTRLPFGTRLPAMLPIEREARARLGNEVTIVSDVYLPPSGLGSHSFAVQYPVRRDGKVVQFLTLASFAAEIQNLLTAQRLPPQWNATITDRRGMIVARSVDGEKFAGKPVREDLLRAHVGARPKASTSAPRSAGWRRPLSSAACRAPAGACSSAVPQTALYAPAGRAAVVMAALSLLVLALGLGAALLVARRISRPVESLRQAAQALGGQGAARAPASGTVELDAVGEAMARASDRLQGTKAELERRVAEALASFEQSQRALVQAQKLEALGRLTGGIAHDFNNVLQTLTAGLETLKLGAGEQQRTLLARCQRAVARGTELARQLMAFGRVQELRAQTIDTGARLAEARHLFGGALPANIRLDYDLEPELWPVRADPSQLELALLNLVINARDAMPHGGSLLLRGRNEAVGRRGDLEPGDYVVLSVSDTGEGMSEDVKVRAFDPFYTTKGVGKGSGMGLPQAYGFARQNGGTLVLDSRPGHGTTATLYLPRTREAVSHDAEAPAAQARVPGKGRVLFVEDDAEVRETVAIALRAAGFEIHTAVTGDEALARLDAGERYEAVFTDVVMPGVLSGVDLATEVRRRFPRMGVVVATGYSDRAVQVEGVRALPKPYDPPQAVDALNAAITSSSA